MRRRRKTKILATLGPASSTPSMIRSLFEAGVDVFRINMSHADHVMATRLATDIRALAEEARHPIGIMVDLQGPKIRLGSIPGGARLLKPLENVRLVLGEASDRSNEIPIPHPEIFQAIKQKHALLIDDGKVRLRLLKKGNDFAQAVVEVPGEIKSRKGVNMPDTLLPLSAMTVKDRRDVEVALSIGADWIALSFVQRPEDVAELKRLVGDKAGVLAKIEKPKAIQNLDGILQLADALMVARGDLGVEMPPEAVPGLQKKIVRAARKAGKPVVVATQMLESMIHSPLPTRAEVSDVAAAIYDSADAVMLSAESASGTYPVEAVQTMDRIACQVERDPSYQELVDAQRYGPEETTADAIMAAVHEVTRTIRARAIVCWTNTGSTALRAARERSPAPIIAVTPNADIARRLALVWGVHCIKDQPISNLDDMTDRALDLAEAAGFAARGEQVVITAGVPLGVTGATNMLRVAARAA
jgi:pyruvate kinase